MILNRTMEWHRQQLHVIVIRTLLAGFVSCTCQQSFRRITLGQQAEVALPLHFH